MVDWVFRVQEPDKAARELSVEDGVTFGRHPDCVCQLADPRVSGRHARVVSFGGSLLIEDVGSSNKTVIDGGPTLVKGEQLPLRPGLQLLMGDTRVEVFDPNAPSGDELTATVVGSAVDEDMMATVVGSSVDEGAAAEAAAKAAAEKAAAEKAAAERAAREAEEKAAKEAEEKAAKEAEEKAAKEAEEKAAKEAEEKAAKEAEEKAAREAEAKAAAAKSAQEAEEKAAAKKAAAAKEKSVPESNSEKKPSKAKASDEESRAVPVPAEPASDVDLGDDDSGMATIATIAGADAPMEGLAKEAAFRAARPRLVVSNDAFGGIVDIDSMEFTVGRSRSRNADYVVKHDGVSGLHARVTFNGRRFFLEDLGSTNGTFLGDEQLAPNTPRELRGDSRVRFGPIESLFVMDENREGLAEAQDAALSLLVSKSKVTSMKRTEAEKAAAAEKRHPGEILIRNGLITPLDWIGAMKDARIIKVVNEPGAAPAKKSPAVFVVILVLVAAAAYAAWKLLG